MKKIIATLIATAFVLSGCTSSSAKAVETVDAKSWISKVSAGNVLIIDVRTPDEYAQGHIANAINMDVEGASFDSLISTLDKNGTYAVYCHSGRRSKIAADTMEKAGFKHIINLNGGMLDLLGAGATLG